MDMNITSRRASHGLDLGSIVRTLEDTPERLGLNVDAAERRLATFELLFSVSAHSAEAITNLYRDLAYARDRSPFIGEANRNVREVVDQSGGDFYAEVREARLSGAIEKLVANPSRFGMTDREVADKLLIATFLFTLSPEKADTLHDILAMANQLARCPAL